MQNNVTIIYDPELIVAASKFAEDLRFWMRLARWSDDPRPKVGPATYLRLLDIVGAPPTVRGLPHGDFWKIVNRLASRAMARATGVYEVCEEHVRATYTPFMGNATNAELLIDAFASTNPQAVVAVATDKHCWSDEREHCDADECICVRLHLYTNPNDALASAWRDRLRPTLKDASDVLHDADKLFPVLTFSPTAWASVGRLSGEPHHAAASLLHHLAALNDYAPVVWSDYAANGQRQAQLASHGIECSPENANIHSDRNAMRARTFDFEDGKRVCEWHTKLHPHIDRIYFCVEGDQVFIGAITDHL